MADFTKQAIKQTFLRLLNEHPLNQITVKLLSKECGINRNTFYYHFSDIPSLIEEIILEEAERTIAAYPTIETLEACVSAALDFARKNRRALYHIYNSANRAIFEESLRRVCRYVVTRYIDTVSEGRIGDVPDGDLITSFYVSLCFGLVMDWMAEGMPDDVEEKVARIYELKRGTAEEMIRRSVEGIKGI